MCLPGQENEGKGKVVRETENEGGRDELDERKDEVSSGKINGLKKRNGRWGVRREREGRNGKERRAGRREERISEKGKKK